MTEIVLDDPAILVWLPTGETATLGSFGGAHIWQCAEQALKHVANMRADHDKDPWLLMGEKILDPQQVRWLISGMLTLQN